MTPRDDQQAQRAPGGGTNGAGIGEPMRGDAQQTESHDSVRRTFARRIDCAVNDVQGSAPRGGRRQPARGRGGRHDAGGDAA